jgi:glycogen synthase
LQINPFKQKRFSVKILIYSPSFYPEIGGLETIISTLAYEFTEQGHDVKLISQTPATDLKQFPFEVFRQPNKKDTLQLIRWCNVYFQGCVSLKGLWPLLFIYRPLAISHQTWYRRNDSSQSWQDYFKKIVTRFATNIACSQAISRSIPGLSTVIPNSYRDDIFHEYPDITRNRNLVFLGRLVSDKGASLLLDAVAQLKLSGLTPNLTIIGNGLEEDNLRQQAKDLGIFEQVEFAGVKLDRELARSLSAHQIMVVPSLWDEPFGIVALEGIACGCVVVGSEGGGLKDAIGGCGATFPNGNVDQLTLILLGLLTQPDRLADYRENARSHLDRHTSKAVTKKYLEVLEAVIND